MKRIIVALSYAVNVQIGWDEGLTPTQSRHNSLTRLLMALFLLFLGMRPFEIARIKIRHVDLPLRLLTVDAKPHCAEKAARRLPLVMPLIRLIEQLLAEDHDSGIRGPRQCLLFLCQSGGTTAPVATETIEDILAEAGRRAGLAGTPKAYAWRHLFCRILLALDLPFHIRRYLMGHEADGIESFNAYSDHDLSQLDIAYQRVADAIVQIYDLQTWLSEWM